MDFKKQLEHASKYAEAFWQHEMIDRPYVSVTAPKEPHQWIWSPVISYNACMNEDYDSVLKPFLQHVESTYYAGEGLPNLELTLGPDQYAGFFGSKIIAPEDAYTTWAKPCVENWADFEGVIDKSENGYYNKIKKYYEYAAEFCKDKFMLCTMDLHGNMDALSALRSPQELCYDLYDCPEDVHEALTKVRKTYPEIYNMVYDTGKMKDVGTMGTAPILCRGRGAVLQCDFSIMIGPEQGKEYFIPAIREEAEILEHAIYHLDGKGALVHLDELLKIDKIDCIQWVPGAGELPTYMWMDVLKKIQNAGKAVWIYDWGPEDIKRYHKELQPDKVAYTLDVESPDVADDLIEFLEKNT